jgi:glutamate synthase domain-containing protein 2/glutamate synthase domain-containing protein 1/glutamate synthase domain-containing protein 3
MAVRAPLYDPAFEHDACGVGFVADARGRSRGRVLPLALSGLAALRHRGAFAADGVSSDGAGVALPLDADLVSLLAPGLGSRAGVVMAFLPRGRAERRARQVIASALAKEGLAVEGWREVPTAPAVLGWEAASSLPVIAQAIVVRPVGWSGDRFELALAVARRRAEAAARAGRSARGGGQPILSIPSASGRLVVYKGLVVGDRLAAFYPDLAEPLAMSHAVFHQRYATNTHPTWPLAQPFRRLSHNGEIDTVRGNREQVRGRSGDHLPTAAGRRLAGAGPLLSPDASDSLSLDEAVEALELTGWDPFAALLALVPDAPALRAEASPLATAHARRSAGFLAPWDGPGAFVLTDGRRVGAMLDRNGLRPLAWAVNRDGVVAAASEAGAVPIGAAETLRRGRLGPGELLLVDPEAGLVLTDPEARTEVLRRSWLPDAPQPSFADRPACWSEEPDPTPAPLRLLAGLDAERHRLHVKTMVAEGHEPLWSMGDDTPLPALGRAGRPVTDHLRQSFAQVTNPPIDPERERAVMDVSVTLGPRPPILGGPPDPRRHRVVRSASPYVADLDGLLAMLPGRSHRLDATWTAADGPGGLVSALERLAADALAAARGGSEVLVVSDAGFDLGRPPIPSVLAIGAVHTALTGAGLRGRTDIVADAADILDVHAGAMALAVGATAVRPRLAIELAVELAGSRGLEEVTASEAVGRLLDAFTAGLRKTLARMGISTAASYIGGALVETIELAPEIVARCFPAAPGWLGRVGFDELAGRILARAHAAEAVAAETASHKLPDPGFARFRGDGEHHGYAPVVVGAIQALATDGTGEPIELELARYRATIAREPATVREQLELRPLGPPVPLDEVEPARAIARRFVASAMSLGALSPEAHQAITIGMQRAGGAANTGEGGEDPAWYEPGPDGERRDSRIKQVASGRFGVTATYLARADQVEIKIAQGSKPGEGGQLPGRKATAFIAALRRGQAGQGYISPPPHHDIYSIEDLAQLIADLRAVDPTARIGVKLVATRGVGTIASGVAKAGADYVHIAGHAGGTGASPLASIKHVGAPWELGLAEAHQALQRNGLRSRVALRTDGGLRTGRDVVIAALLGAEEFAFGTALLVALGCDMARQCHLDTCPTGIATQRDDLRAKFSGTPEQVERFVLAIAEDVRLELATLGARSIGELVGEAHRALRPRRRIGVGRPPTLDLAAVTAAPPWDADVHRRADPAASVGAAGARPPASPVEAALVEALASGRPSPTRAIPITTADRSFGAALSGALERGEIAGPVAVRLAGAAGQSFGAFACAGVDLRLDGVANDYVGKGLSGGTLVVAPEADLGAAPDRNAIVGNTCLYGATAGRLHVIGRAGMRFGVRNSGASAVVEGIGPHGAEYMTGGAIVVLGPVGPNFGAGMTGGRAYLWDPSGAAPRALDERSVRAASLAEVIDERTPAEAEALLTELRTLLADHAEAGSLLADHLVDLGGPAPAHVWLVEPIPVEPPAEPIPVEPPAEPIPVGPGPAQPRVRVVAVRPSDGATGPQPHRTQVGAEVRAGGS